LIHQYVCYYVLYYALFLVRILTSVGFLLHTSTHLRYL